MADLFPKWAKANHVFLITREGKMGPLPTRDFQGCLAQEKILFLANCPIAFDQDG